jgi:HEAT repeat protein
MVNYKTMAGVCLIAIIVGLFLFRNNLLYSYYMWRLTNTNEGALILDIHQSLKNLGPSNKGLIFKTFQDKNANWKNIHAATLLILDFYKEEAEKIFSKYLTIGNDNQKAEAIFGLSELFDKKHSAIVIKLSTSSNIIIKENVAKYLANINSEEVIEVLKKLAKDRNESVKLCAKESIRKLKMVGSHGEDYE